MSEPKIAQDEAAIVLVGAFNPAIFHPAWLAHHGLIPEHEAEAASVQIISNEVAVIVLKWARIEVTRDRFSLRSNDETHFEPLRDLAVAIFQLLEHTPIKQIGLNRDIQFELPTEDEWHKIGHKLAPKDIWAKHLKEPGMARLSIQSVRPDDFKGTVIVSVYPSGLKLVTIAVNDHYDLGDVNGRKASEIIAEKWNSSIERAIELAKLIYVETIQ